MVYMYISMLSITCTGGNEFLETVSMKFLITCNSYFLFTALKDVLIPNGDQSLTAPLEFWTQCYKTFFMLNSTEHEFFLVHKCKNTNIYEQKNSVIGLSESEKKTEFLDIFIRAFKIPCATELSMKKKFYNLGPCF